MTEHEPLNSRSKFEGLTNELNRPCINVALILGIILVVISCSIGSGSGFLLGTSYNSHRISEGLVVINQDDPFVPDIAQEFNLSQVILKYDQVINAIEGYHHEKGSYPPNLSALVPDYLPEVPGIYIRGGGSLEYLPEPEWEGASPFTFYISGNYLGLAFMHGWELKYCPSELGLCNETNDRHFHPHRINYRWIWVSSSAL
jgi:hypothetical protein